MTEQNLRPPFRQFAAILAVSVGGLLGLTGCGGEDPPPPPAQLMETAAQESAPPESQREAAARLLAHPQAQREDYRKLAKESRDPVVRATAYSGMGRTDDWDSMPELLDAMEDPDPYVRGQAGAAVVKILGVDMGFDARGAEDERARIVEELRVRYNKVKGHYHGGR